MSALLILHLNATKNIAGCAVKTGGKGQFALARLFQRLVLALALGFVIGISSTFAQAANPPGKTNAPEANGLPGDIQVASSTYPKVYYRGPEYAGMHCLVWPSTNPPNELYLLKTTLNDLPVGKKREIEVSEFFSGQQYKAQAVNEGEYRVNLTNPKKSLMLRCELERMVKFFGKSSTINTQGDYLSYENVEAETGKWGDILINNKCDVDGVWEACDIGLRGISRRRSDGSVVWARLLAVAVPYPDGQGHPVWGFPDALNVYDANWDGTWLGDGTALFTIDFGNWHVHKYGNRYGPTVRINMNTGALMENHAEVAIVPLDDWAALKHSLWERWVGESYPCGPLGSKDEVICRARMTEMYFYIQQNYLFPLLATPFKK